MIDDIEQNYKSTLNLIRLFRKGTNIDGFILNFIKLQIDRINMGLIDELEIGNCFGIFIQKLKTEGYKISKDVEKLLYELGDYKIIIGELKLRNLSNIKKEVNRIERRLKK